MNNISIHECSDINEYYIVTAGFMPKPRKNYPKQKCGIEKLVANKIEPSVVKYHASLSPSLGI